MGRPVPPSDDLAYAVRALHRLTKPHCTCAHCRRISTVVTWLQSYLQRQTRRASCKDRRPHVAS